MSFLIHLKLSFGASSFSLYGKMKEVECSILMTGRSQIICCAMHVEHGMMPAFRNQLIDPALIPHKAMQTRHDYIIT